MNLNSLKVLWYILPLFLVAVFIVFNNPQGSNFWLSISHHHYLKTLNNGSSTMVSFILFKKNIISSFFFV